MITSTEQNGETSTPTEFDPSTVDLGALYGLKGVSLSVAPNPSGSYCDYSGGEIKINIDPSQIKGVPTKEQLETPGDLPDAVVAMFIAAHEFGHAHDIVKEPGLTARKSKADSFFYNLLDDMVNDCHSRRIPIFDHYGDDVYRQSLPARLTNMPLSGQFMYALRISSFNPNAKFECNPKVLEAVSTARSIIIDGKPCDVVSAIAYGDLTLRERYAFAEQFIKPIYDGLIEQDPPQSKQQESGCFRGDKGKPKPGKSGNSNHDSGSLSDQIVAAIRAQATDEREKKRAVAQKVIAAERKAQDAERQAEIGSLAGTCAREMELDDSMAYRYAESLINNRDTIKSIAKIFLKLAGKTETTNSPRYGRNPAPRGSALHSRTLSRIPVAAAIGDNEPAVWHPTKHIGRQYEIGFGGFDVYILVDVSGSMSRDNKAQCAADTTLCLIEGLQLAREQASAGPHLKQPDVQTEIVAFGGNYKVLSQLCKKPSGAQKGLAYSGLLNPCDIATLIGDALSHVSDQCAKRRDRHAIVMIVSDGDFGDKASAEQHASNMPSNSHIKQILIGGGDTVISSDHETVSSPDVLPEKLLGLLRNQIMGDL